jgi:hypothetical protein
MNRLLAPYDPEWPVGMMVCTALSPILLIRRGEGARLLERPLHEPGAGGQLQPGHPVAGRQPHRPVRRHRRPSPQGDRVDRGHRPLPYRGGRPRLHGPSRPRSTAGRGVLGGWEIGGGGGQLRTRRRETPSRRAASAAATSCGSVLEVMESSPACSRLQPQRSGSRRPQAPRRSTRRLLIDCDVAMKMVARLI